MDQLSTAFFINRMKELHSRMEKAHGKSEALCEMCSGGKATAFCRQCASFICDKCIEPHQRMKMFAGHVVSTLDEIKQNGKRYLIIADTYPQNCANHEEPKKIFCFDCNHLICRDCVVIDHTGHKYEFVKKAAPVTRKKLAEHLSPLKNLLPDLSTAVSRVRDTKQEIKAEGELVEKQVNAKFQELHDILEQCKDRVLRQSCDIVERKMEKLTVQEKGLELSVGCVQSLVDFVERTLENASDEELITMQEQVVSRIDGEVVRRGKEAASADPVENADFGVEVFVSEDLKKLCENNVALYEDTPIVRGDGTRSAEVNKIAKLKLSLPRNSNQPIPPAVTATLESLVDQTSLPLEAVPVSKGVYSIEYTPKVRGQHHLVISVNGQPIPGSPFSVFVRIHPTKLDKPVRVIGKFSATRYAAFLSSEEVVITESSGDIVVLNKKGERVRCISKSQFGLKFMCGVAVDKDDNIYVSDFHTFCLHKFDKSGELLKKLEGKDDDQGEFESPRGVAVDGDRVFVCGSSNDRVHVLTTELEPVEQFGSRGTGPRQFSTPEDIAVDSEGMLYVSDSGNCRVQVFTRDGQFVRSFGKKGSGQGELYGPRGVCVCDGYVYAAEFCNSRVSVFTRDGQFVTSFGVGHITRPYGVSLDSDGFVYVCSKQRVVVF